MPPHVRPRGASRTELVRPLAKSGQHPIAMNTTPDSVYWPSISQPFRWAGVTTGPAAGTLTTEHRLPIISDTRTPLSRVEPLSDGRSPGAVRDGNRQVTVLLLCGLHTAGEDPACRLLIRARDEAEFERALSDLLVKHVMPVAESGARRVFGKDSDSVEAVVGDVICGFVAKMRLSRNGDAEHVRLLKPYVAQLLRSSVAKRLAQLNPEFSRLRRRIVFQLRHDPNLAYWQDSKGVAWCGSATLQHRDGGGGPRATLIKIAPRKAAQSALGGRAPEDVSDVVLVAALLSWLKAPIPVTDLVKAVARLRDIRPPDIAELDSPDAPDPIAPKPEGPSPEEFETMVTLWGAIKGLPLRQRSVILLQMRDEDGSDAMDLLIQYGVASLREVATVLEIPWDTFADLWTKLPLDDESLAGLLHISLVNVRQLRFQARAKLRVCLAEERR